MSEIYITFHCAVRDPEALRRHCLDIAAEQGIEDLPESLEDLFRVTVDLDLFGAAPLDVGLEIIDQTTEAN